MGVLSPTELESKLGVIVERLRAALSPVAIYFFGSYVYGEPSPDSDLDLLVVVEDSSLSAFQRDTLAYRALRGLGVAKDVQVYTRREFDERSQLPVSFERTVKEQGKLLYAA